MVADHRKGTAMVRPRKALRVLSMLAVLLSWTTASQADLVESFDDDESLSTWSLSGDDVYRLGGQAVLRENDSYMYSPDGSIFVPGDEEPFPPENFSYTSIERGCELTTEGTVAVSFWFQLQGVGSETDYFQVLLDGIAINIESTASLPPGESGTIERMETLYFPNVTNSNPMLMFRLKGHNDGNVSVVLLDDVACSIVPVPGAVLLGSIGLGYAGMRMRRRTGAEA